MRTHGKALDLAPGAAAAPRRRPRMRTALLVLAGATLLKILLGGMLASLLGFSLETVPTGMAAAGADTVRGGEAPPSDSLVRTVARLEEALARQVPRQPWIVVDRGNNRLWVRNRNGVLLEAVVSTGSGAVLRERGDKDHEERSWTFDTPAGRFHVIRERQDPVWVKPDWAYLEEGLQPPAKLAERRDEGSLGAWALDLGGGYMIHGTLYERLLGRSTTHGCIRVGSEDLARIASLAHPGTTVLIF